MASQHTLHIPVMGTCFSIDTPMKIAPLGYNSVISLVDDELIQTIGSYHGGDNYPSIKKTETNSRSKRITTYLNLVREKVKDTFERIKHQDFLEGKELTTYFEMLPENSQLKQEYNEMLKANSGRSGLEKKLLDKMEPGSIDANIMTKLGGSMEALKGFAESNLSSAIVFSAGSNMPLYTYIEEFDDFYPQEGKEPRKKIILKVSDLKSAQAQGRFLARKGLWVDEYRIESGLNCGGHTFATEGKLIGPVLEEFKQKKEELINDLYAAYIKALEKKGKSIPKKMFISRITVQGGITTGNENKFLFDNYKVDGTGSATPFLLVPEVTSVDSITLNRLIEATNRDVQVSNSSPLGVPFQNLMTSLSEDRRRLRIERKTPGIPCINGFLKYNTEFTPEPICTASRQYQRLKLTQLESEFANMSLKQYETEKERVMQKSCICYQLGDSALLLYGIMKKEGRFPAICPGPNIVDFNRLYSLKEMTGHFYGREQIITTSKNMFIKELGLYIDHFDREKGKVGKEFVPNLFSGIKHYERIAEKIHSNERNKFRTDLSKYKERLETLEKKYKK